MDPDLVRLILVLFGVTLVVGIYLWDQYKRAAPGSRRGWRSARGRRAGDGERIAQRAEPVMQSATEPVAEAPAGAADSPPAADPADAPPEPIMAAPARRPAAQRDETSRPRKERRVEARADADRPGRGSPPGSEVAPKIVVINLAARDGVIGGPAIERACAAAGLSPGEMSIYHRVDPASGRVLFSMASMVEPGAFPFDAMTGFTTPGLTLFTQLEGAGDDIETYDAMLATAQRLAQALRAELRDERHNKLTRQMQEHTREAIIEHKRKIRLARSRR